MAVLQIIPNAAVRDEGTSYHYMPPSDEIRVNQKHMEMLTRLLDKMHVTYTVGKVWTTDAFYRETVEKVKRRKMQGCICQESDPVLLRSRQSGCRRMGYQKSPQL